MKKIWGSMLAISAVIILAACSAEEKATVQGVYDETLKASEELTSFQMEMEQDISMGENNSVSQTATGKVNTDPLAFHQKMNMMNQEMEMYYTEEAMYLQQPGQDQWVKAPADMMEQLNQLTQSQQKPTKQLEQLEQYVDDFSMEEKENTYVLSISSSGDKMKDFIKETLEENMPEGTMSEDMLKGLTINNLEYTFTIQKDTYYPKQLDLTMDLSMEQNGTTADMKQEVQATYSKYNEVGEITVPEDIKNNAKEMSMPQSSNSN
ncbi:DUF6612 family protein [Pontibacillus salicampi]|uniref:DUF6612 family protein n=1 Tax=Pontibacillus salicampi TaxID=1449801 RepID=A0ABV6LNJ1_9BACI